MLFGRGLPHGRGSEGEEKGDKKVCYKRGKRIKFENEPNPSGENVYPLKGNEKEKNPTKKIKKTERILRINQKQNPHKQRSQSPHRSQKRKRKFNPERVLEK